MTYGVDALRQIFLQNANQSSTSLNEQINPTMGVEIFGHITTVWENILVVAIIGSIFMIIATWSFSKQE